MQACGRTWLDILTLINVHYSQADLIFTNAIYFCVQYALDQGQPTLLLEGYFPVHLTVIFK